PKTQFLRARSRPARHLAMKEHELRATIVRHVDQGEHPAETLMAPATQRGERRTEQRVSLVTRCLGFALHAQPGGGLDSRAVSQCFGDSGHGKPESLCEASDGGGTGHLLTV